MRRRFVTLAERHASCTAASSATGPPVVLLHPSPQSGAFSLPMARRLAPNFTAIALDTPGYGLSDPLPGAPTTPALDEYLPPLRMFLDALGLQRVALYGNATGAEIAQLFAHAHPDRVALCMLDTAGHKEDAALDAMLEGYFPDVTPRRDGGHLLTHWDMVRSLGLFSPWHATDAAHRLTIDLPEPAVLHAKMLDYLRAGPAYAAAYRPAFYTAKHALISRIRVPVTLTRWEDKPDLSEVDALIARGLPPNFTVLRPGPGVDARLGVAERHLLEHYRPGAAPMPPLPEQVDASRGALAVLFHRRARRAVASRGSASRAQAGRCSGCTTRRARRGASKALMSPWLGRRPLVAFDNPGNGESDPLLAREAISTEAYAALHGSRARRARHRGRGGDRPLFRRPGGAWSSARQRPGLVRHLVQAGVMIFEPRERDELLAHYTPSIEPRWDGSHLVTAWSIVRDMSLFWPWYNRRAANVIRRDAAIDAASVDLRVQDLLKLGDAWQRGLWRLVPLSDGRATRGTPTVPCLLADYPGAASQPRLGMARPPRRAARSADIHADPGVARAGRRLPRAD